MNPTLAKIVTIISLAAGVAGSIITPIYGVDLASAVQGVLQAVSALLVLIPSAHATALVYQSAKIDLEVKAGLYK